MTPRTRRRVMIAVVVVAVALPLEVVLINAISFDSDQAAQQWVDGLSGAELDAAAANVQGYPVPYRKAIVNALTPVRISEVWQGHIQQYVDDHPDLGPAAVSLLEHAIALASPETFDEPSPDVRDEILLVADQATTLLGRADVQFLLYRLGPPDGTPPSSQSLSARLSESLRSFAVVLARFDDCDCAFQFDCTEPLACDDSTGCEEFQAPFACGPLGLFDCVGACLIVEGN